ncbi:formimidoylglutamate deiminase [Leucothrix mucor]|uniref:formimidoylglutamate deiminase n=1 Tax=Leucothrix mucor TaxID=45248 RepID=UPI0003B538A4|nr:formimidoylglutamate deiminase [Leucothrix mucor]
MNTLHVTHALLSTGWAENVRISIDAAGTVSKIETDIAGANSGCLLPGMANLHSHAHQRAMAGLAERAGSTDDSFWTWRKIMYQFLQAIQPEQLHAIAAQLYVEMLKSGYTRVAEFQYLHHQPSGQHYDNPAEMSLQTLQAARETGLGMTNLPVHYQFGGFGEQPLGQQQQRFANDPELFLRIVEELQHASANDANVVTGMAAHSLRAVGKQGLSTILASLQKDSALPVHIHIAEQTKEVNDCIAWSGLRPVEYLLDNFKVDQHWCLIHATHMSESETRAVAGSGAVVGICPATEGNLGDGFFNAVEYLKAGGQFGIGSDSHISVSPSEELRWLEYGQRLLHRSRNVLAGGYERSTGRTIFDKAVAGGAQACGHNSGAIAVGKRADFIVLDTNHPLLCERSGDELLDSWIFSGNSNAVRDVCVGGKHVIQGGHHAQEAAIADRFKSTLKTLRN